MTILLMIITIIGLCLFEVISSIDNAVINAEVLSTMGEKAKRWFFPEIITARPEIGKRKITSAKNFVFHDEGASLLREENKKNFPSCSRMKKP